MNSAEEAHHLVDIVKLELEASKRATDKKECSVCHSKFNFLFNKKLNCKDCSVSLCRSCASWDAFLTCWICSSCQNKREISRRCGRSLYSQSKFKTVKAANHNAKKKGESDSENDSGYGAPKDGAMHSLTFPESTTSGLEEEENHFSLDSTEVDPTTAEVRDHIETLIEGMIGTRLDTASITRLYNHLEYDQMFTNYKKQLTEILAQLAYSLHMAINQQPLSQDDVPTSVHCVLKNILLEILKDAKLLPDLAEFQVTPPSSPRNEEQILSAQTYEDILSVAILNQVIEVSQEEVYGPMDYSVLNRKIQESDVDTDEDKNIFKVSKPRKRIDGVVDDWKMLASVDSSEGIDVDEDFRWLDPDDTELKIEEEIEITSYERDVETEEQVEPVVRRMPSSELSYLYSSLDFLESPEVSFPEWGKELSNASDVPDDDHLKSITSVDTWEDNWLFQRKRLKHSQGLLGIDPVPMLVPNPEDDVKVRIGDRDMEELSDLSESSYKSVESFSDDEEPSPLIEAISPNVPPPQTFWPKGDLSSEFSQKDVEYTEHIAELDKLSMTSTSSSSDVPIGKKVPKLTNHPKFIPSSERAKQVGDDPRFLHLPSEALNIHTHAGRAVRLICKVHGTQPLDVWWYRGGEPLLADSRVVILSNGCEHQLHLYDTERRDSTTYSCLVTNAKGQAWQDFKIYFKETSRAESVPEFLCGLNDVKGTVGRSCRFECTISGYPEPRVKFFKEDQQLLPGNNCSLEFLGYGMWVVILKHLKESDSGEYNVYAENKLGRARSSANLSITSQSVENNIQLTLDTSPKKTTMNKVGNQLPQKVIRKPKRIIDEAPREVEQSVEFNQTMRKDELLPQPPLPGSWHEGTIAEREHRKWSEQAIKLEHNPYSAENLKKRMQFGRKLGYQNIITKSSDQDDSYAEFDSDNENQQEMVNGDGSKIYCGLKNIDPNKYQRDYYVKGSKGKSDHKKWELHHKLSDPTYSSTLASPSTDQPKFLAVGDQIAKFQTAIHDSEGNRLLKATSVTNLNGNFDTSCMNGNRKEDLTRHYRPYDPPSKLHNKKWVSCENLAKVEIISRKDFTNVISGQNGTSSADSEPLKLPSVKQLANKFSPISVDSTEKKLDPVLETDNIVIVDKDGTSLKVGKSKHQKSRHSSIQEVHSLTARSVSKEFREAMRQQLSQPQNRNITLVKQQNISSGSEEERNIPSPENMGIPSGLCHIPQRQGPVYTSDDSTTSQNSVSSDRRPRKKLTKTIATRAAFWDRRVENGLISDKDVPDILANC